MSSRPAWRRARTGALVLGPAVFAAGLVAHPFVHDYTESSVVADAVLSAPHRWTGSHLVLAFGVMLLLLAVLAMRDLLSEAGEDRWSDIGTGLLVAGGTLLAAIVGSEITLGAVAHADQDVQAVMEQAVTLPLYGIGILLFAVGWLCVGLALHRSQLLSIVERRAGVAAAIVIPVAALVPQTTGTYLYGAAVVIIMWLLAYRSLSGKPLARGAGT